MQQSKIDIPANQIEVQLRKEYRTFTQKFKYPKRPNQKKQTCLIAIDHVVKEKGVPGSEAQTNIVKRAKSKIEFRFWKSGINKILDKFTEEQFEEQFLKFILSLDYANVSDHAKEAISNEILEYHVLSQKAQKFLIDWLKIDK